MSVINLKNYRKGLIKGYELAYQDPQWYRENKDNFCSSLKENYSELFPLYAQKSKSKNYLGFLPTDLIRFGKLNKINIDIEGKSFSFWTVIIPEGFSLYHSSRALGLNHSDFPIIGYENKKSADKNREISQNICPDDKFIGKTPEDIENACTYVSYYSTPYLTKEYLRKDTGFGGNSIKYAYGIGTTSGEKDNRLYNDRLRYVASPTKDGKLKITESQEGVSAYRSKEDMELFILGLDDILIDRPNLGKENLRTFYEIMLLLRKQINVDDATFERFLDLIVSVGGIGSLADNVNTILRDYPQAKNFGEGLEMWLKRNYKHYKENPLNTAGIIREFYKSDLTQIPGFRFSTYEHDRVVMNMLSWLFNDYYNNKVLGFTSSSLYVYSKGKGDVSSGKFFQVDDLTFYSSKGYFHSELGLFFAPDILDRDRTNKYDLEYSLNYLGIIQEYRKFKTENLAPNGFHQGHLLEHNAWVSLVAGSLRDKYKKYGSDKISENIYLLAGFLHDLGKSGNCDVKAVYRNLNPQEAFMSVCHFEKDNTDKIIGMKYHSLPAHPSEGYEYLKGYRPYNLYTLSDKIQKLYFDDWEKYFDHLKLDKYQRRIVRIAVGAHWYFGYYLDKFLKVDDDIKIDDDIKVNDGNKIKLIEEYVRRIETFYNDEFFTPDKEDFMNIVTFVITVSIADVLGSEYNPLLEDDGLSGDEKATILNYLPNISLSDVKLNSNNKIQKPSEVINKIIEKSLENTQKAYNKKQIFKNLREYSDIFIEKVMAYIKKDFYFNKGNTYSILFNLQNIYPGIGDVHRAYPLQMPKVIAFDLDQTLLSTKFFSGKPVEYNIYEDTYKIIKECQDLRRGILEEDGSRIEGSKIYIALTTRHYAPKTLKAFLLKEKIEVNGKFLENPLYYKNFDFIVSKYTGEKEYIYSQVQNYDKFFEENGTIDQGFIMDDKAENYEIPYESKFLEYDQISKAGHYNLVKRKYGIEYSDILAYDDDSKYFKENKMKGLGEAKNVYVAAALSNDEGLKYSLFRDGLSFYVFDKIRGFRSY